MTAKRPCDVFCCSQCLASKCYTHQKIREGFSLITYEM
jgi:hypothetical protein